MNAQTVRARAGHKVGRLGAKTRRLLLEELAAQLEDKPLAELAVVDVARGAGVSPATFYQYFPGIKSAAVALARMLRADGEPLPDGLVDQRARADALASALEKLHSRIHNGTPNDGLGGLVQYADSIMSELETEGAI